MLDGSLPLSAPLPEAASVPWRPRADERSLTRSGRWWTLSTVAHTVPFIAVAAFLLAAKPLTAPVALIALAHAWIIPELYASRGAGVLRPPLPSRSDPRPTEDRAVPERVALGLLGDLVGHEARDLLGRTGLVMEPGRHGVWLIGQAGAILVRPGGRRVMCLCIKATGDGLPAGDRIAHLLLALRSDEEGFLTVANLAFSGARWRLARRVSAPAREALGVAARRSLRT